MGIADAEHAEERPDAPTLLITPVSCPVPDRREGAPRLSGALRIRVLPGTRARDIVARDEIEEEYFCNYELNPAYQSAVDAGGLRVSGVGAEGEARIVELPGHPFYVGTLFQPQRASRPGTPHPVIVAFLEAAARHGAAPGRGAAEPVFDPRPVTLESPRVRLVPLERAHADALFEAGRDESTWRWLSRPPLRDADDARLWIAEAHAGLDSGAEVPFAILEPGGGRLIGTTRYMEIRRADRSLEIGWTWLAPGARRTPVNTECKYLLLAHAFETLGAVRVQFKTDLRNLPSQRAIERLGAIREGVLRRHRIVRDGYARNTVMYSVIDAEWPLVKARLEALRAP